MPIQVKSLTKLNQRLSQLTWRQLAVSDSVVTTVCLILIASLLALSGLLSRFDALYFDLGRYIAFKSAPKDVVIVAVDEASLAQIGRWPWSRSVHAELVSQLSEEKASVIGLDIIFSESDVNNPNADDRLQAAIANAKNVVLPTLYEVPFAGAAIKQTLPLAKFSEHAAALGRVHVPLDADGLARSIYLSESLIYPNAKTREYDATRKPQNTFQDVTLREKLNGFSQTHTQTVSNSTFAAALLHVAGKLPKKYVFNLVLSQENSPQNAALSAPSIARQNLRLVNFIGPPGHFQRISYVDALSGNYPHDYFKHKMVLIGATAVGLGDVLPTSVSGLSQPMPGVEFHANVLEATRNNTLIAPIQPYLVVLFSALLAMAPVLWLRKLNPFKSLIWIVVYFIAVILSALVIAHFFQLWFPPVSVLVAIILAYPLWSWRKLESAQRFLDEELQNLQAELALIGADASFLAVSDTEDALQSRITRLKSTAEKLRHLHHDRNDTLAFISHDLRAPLGSAMMLMKEAQTNKHVARAMQMLGRAHNMAEQFLQVSRAEMASSKSFQPLELLGLLQQVQDDVYAEASAKSLRIKTITTLTELWVLGDFGLLQRAFANVLSNAIKYAPLASTITIEILFDGKQANVSITDLGHGIPVQNISRLFKRFSRAEGAHQSVDGTGLGLYFVHTVFLKHNGNVTVTSQTADEAGAQVDIETQTYTTFKLTLPVFALE